YDQRYRRSEAGGRGSEWEAKEHALAVDLESRRPEHAGVSTMRRAHAAGVVRISLDDLGALSASICDSARQQGLRDVLIAKRARHEEAHDRPGRGGGRRDPRHRPRPFEADVSLARRDRAPAEGFVALAREHADRHTR